MFVLRSDWCGIFAREAVSNGDILCHYHKEDLLFLKWILLLLQFSPALSHMTHACILVSMTSLLTHTVSHFTRPSVRPKTNNLPLLKVFKSCSHLSKSWQNEQNSDIPSQFSMSKNIWIFLKKNFIEEYVFRDTLFVIDIFWQLQFLNHFIF